MSRKVAEEALSTWTKQGDAILTSKAKIVSVANVSGKTYEKSGFTPEVGLEVVFEIEGYERLTKINIFSKYKRKENGEIIGFSYRSSVVAFLNRVLERTAEVNDDWSLDPKELKLCEGKEVYILKYGKGIYEGGEKPTVDWQHWDRVGITGERLADEFKESVNKGFPNDYNPNSFDLLSKILKSNKDNETNFNYGANAQSNFDDDLPV